MCFSPSHTTHKRIQSPVQRKKGEITFRRLTNLINFFIICMFCVRYKFMRFMCARQMMSHNDMNADCEFIVDKINGISFVTKTKTKICFPNQFFVCCICTFSRTNYSNLIFCYYLCILVVYDYDNTYYYFMCSIWVCITMCKFYFYSKPVNHTYNWIQNLCG